MSMCDERDARSFHPPGSDPPPHPPERLKAERVQLGLDGLPGWEQTLDGSRIYRAFLFQSPETPPRFAALAYALAKESGHYPTVTLLGSTVVCQLTTPEAEGVTEKDLEMARRISLFE
jgi:4a-hydroxytetrahydrobiopterin dehydratase